MSENTIQGDAGQDRFNPFAPQWILPGVILKGGISIYDGRKRL